jgi:hypothetical protein
MRVISEGCARTSRSTTHPPNANPRMRSPYRTRTMPSRKRRVHGDRPRCGRRLHRRSEPTAPRPCEKLPRPRRHRTTSRPQMPPIRRRSERAGLPSLFVWLRFRYGGASAFPSIGGIPSMRRLRAAYASRWMLKRHEKLRTSIACHPNENFSTSSAADTGVPSIIAPLNVIAANLPTTFIRATCGVVAG